MGSLRWRVSVVAGLCVAGSFSLPFDPSPRAHAAKLVAQVTQVKKSSTATKKKAKHCEVKVVDGFTDGVGLMDIQQNTQVTALDISANQKLQIPALPEVRTVLQAQPQATDSPQTVGHAFVIPQNWSKADGIGFWYHGQNTGKPIQVEVRGQSAPDPGPSGWTLRWGDDFNGPAGSAPDPSVWGYDTGDGGNGWGNSELEYYTKKPDNVALDGDGHLVITARAEPAGTTLACYYGPCQYTSARLLTENKLEVGYGRIEARVKIPTGTGLWPAFWMLGSNIDSVGWPQSGEVDIMENVGRQPNTLYGTAHGPGYSGADGLSATYTASAPLSDDFHTYTIDWTARSITWYIDGTKYHEVTPKDTAPNKWVFNHPFFLLLNMAIGGGFGGPVDPSLTFPQSMSVDYVHVYSAPDTAARFDARFTDNFTGWKHISIPFKSFKRSATQPAGAPTGKLSLKTINGYSLTVPAGTPNPVLLTQVQTEHTKTNGACLPE